VPCDRDYRQQRQPDVSHPAHSTQHVRRLRHRYRIRLRVRHGIYPQVWGLWTHWPRSAELSVQACGSRACSPHLYQGPLRFPVAVAHRPRPSSES
jgi:hypothetical protein